MSKKRKINANQLSFNFDQKIEEYVNLKQEILTAPTIPQKQFESWEECCIENAAAIKRAIKQSGLSREQVVDAINEYFGWSTEAIGKNARKPLSIHIFNHYLSKPTQYPIPSFYIYAIQHVTGSLEPCISFTAAEDAKVISGDEVRQMTIGKLDETILEMQRLKKELRMGARK